MLPILEKFTSSLNDPDPSAIGDVEAYIQWLMESRTAEFDLAKSSDVDIRTYLLHLKNTNVPKDTIRRKIDSLEWFYDWARSEQLIHTSPFSHFDFKTGIENDARSEDARDPCDSETQERELVRLRALNHLASRLNRSVDFKSAITTTLNTLVSVMGLRSAWASLWNETVKPNSGVQKSGSHDFSVVGSCNLPQGLEVNNRFHLSKPPDCHCQNLLRTGRLQNAVNVVECSRLRSAASTEGDTEGLMYHATVPLIAEGRPLGVINVATENWNTFSETDLKLLSVAGEQVASAIVRAQLYDDARHHRERMERELQMAKAVQTSLIPDTLPEINGFDLGAEWTSVREIAGDFFDIFPVDGGRWGFIVADVSGKGAPAALYMAMARAVIRSEAFRSASPSTVLTEVNRILLSQTPEDMFVTVFYGIINPADRTLTYANCGHESPFLKRNTGKIEHLQSTGPLVGVFEGVPFEETKIELNPGDVVLAYTDGVTDAQNEEGEMYGEERLMESLARIELPCDSLSLKKHVLSDLDAFVGKAEQVDDITFFLVICRD